MSVATVTHGIYILVPITVDELQVNPVFRQCVVFSKLCLTLGVSLRLGLSQLLLQLGVDLAFKVRRRHSTTKRAFLPLLKDRLDALHAERVLARQGAGFHHHCVAHTAVCIYFFFLHRPCDTYSQA